MTVKLRDLDLISSTRSLYKSSRWLGCTKSILWIRIKTLGPSPGFVGAKREGAGDWAGDEGRVGEDMEPEERLEVVGPEYCWRALMMER